ncbi:MAG: hypothetical protein N2712_02955 [Brevinematales bacterium]|nr:hypothetical protein [Brevinematales bacterium]
MKYKPPKKKTIVAISILLLVMLMVTVYAQKSNLPQQTQDKEKMVVGGDEGFFKRNYTRFKGNAYVEKGSTKMLADIIEYFETNNLAIGRGNVVLKDTKSGLTVFGGYSEYFGNNNIITFYENPQLVISNNILLKGEAITLNQNEESITSKTNAYLSNNNNQIFAETIIVLSKLNIIKLIEKSTILSSNIVIQSDRGIIIITSNKVTKEMEISQYIGTGRVKIIGTNFTLESDKIVINFTNNEVKNYIATGNVKISNTNNIISSQYFMSEFSGGRDILHIGMTNVVIVNLENNDTLYSDYLFSDKKNNYELLTGNVIYVLNNGSTKIKAQSIERFLNLSMTLLKKDVILETENISIASEIAKYDEKLKIMYMVGNPRVVNEDKLGVSANIITINIQDKSSTIENGNYGYITPGM